ncbi:hypothetical protein KKC32_05370 [Patescibacteria group bacterium]|nr:hypothetical protein [Patescibacteria group bacterium]
MKNKLLIGFVMLVLAVGALFTVLVPQASAIDEAQLREGGLQEIGEALGEADGAELPARIGNFINILLGVLGVVLVLIIVYAGFLWMTAGGDTEQVKKAKSWMINAVIGLIIILSSYAISSFVIEKLVQTTTGVS